MVKVGAKIINIVTYIMGRQIFKLLKYKIKKKFKNEKIKNKNGVWRRKKK